MHHMDSQARISFWNDHINNQNILHPKIKDGCRLAGFSCVPLVGQVPTEEAWEGVTLPRHGVLRTRNHPLQKKHDEQHTKDSSIYLDTFLVHGTPGYPWSYVVEQKTRFMYSADIVRCELMVTRSQYCQEVRPMPLSFGMSFYVATQGQHCLVQNGATEVFDSKRHLRREGERFRTNLSPLTVETELGNLLISQHTIFDDVELWSREPECYLSVAVSAGRREVMLLEPGQMRYGFVDLSYLRK
jgi:hypothetical protein